MKSVLSFTALCCLLFSVHSLAADELYWPTFRGPVNSGVAPDADPPVSWSETENVKWKVELPGTGLSSPVIWGDKVIFLTSIPTKEEQPAETAAPAPPRGRGGRGGGFGGFGGFGGGRKPTTKYKFDVVCLDRKTGNTLWQKTVKEAIPHEGKHGDSTYASYSPVTDGKLIWANFGSWGLHCLDFEGNLKWSRDLIQQRIRATFGEGSSPCIAGKAIIAVCDHEGQSYIYAFDKVSGEPLWKKERDEATNWASPIAIEVKGKTQVIVNGKKFVRAYDTETGDVIWMCTGQTTSVIPTPVAGLGNVYVASGFRGTALYAIDPTKTGDVTNTDAVLWKVTEGRTTPYVPSPILIDGKIYVNSENKETVSCYDAKTGKAHYVGQKLTGLRGIYSSPVGASGRVYYAGRNGVVSVIKTSDTFETLATNTLDDKIDATPAIVGNEIYIKGLKNLYCIAKK